MEQVPLTSDVERRKRVRLCLRHDLEITTQRYEGKTYYVIKDPVSLRYYRLDEKHCFLVRFLNGTHTLDDAQKEFENHFRPDRLTLEELEAFGQQLLMAGLAHNESPQAGKLLFERRRKRVRREWLQTLTNILYIKVPVFDPDRLLTRMLPYMRWIFTTTFFALSVGVMLAAILLVATHFDTFRDKLPSFRTFFSFRTLGFMWMALGVVKVIHEFGHGLSCKAFGGECHEMGALILCLSPALYCNVSDAWTLPSKWRRIIISFAGIYVELIIASLATFLWWNTPGQPFINNFCLSLMVVCSVSTVMFNGNPLMRYDGYYILCDWMEIPNLRDRANRFLKNLVLEHCLGIEVRPEPYMALGRRILFVTFTVISWIYRWVITFVILRFLALLLRPYKLEVLSSLLVLAALVSMIGWPLYRMGENLYKRGRLPDMKQRRVLIGRGDRGVAVGILRGAVADQPGAGDGSRGGAAGGRRFPSSFLNPACWRSFTSATASTSRKTISWPSFAITSWRTSWAMPEPITPSVKSRSRPIAIRTRIRQMPWTTTGSKQKSTRPLESGMSMEALVDMCEKEIRALQIRRPGKALS